MTVTSPRGSVLTRSHFSSPPSAFLEELPEALLRKVGHTPAYVAQSSARKSGAKECSASGQQNEAGGFRIGQSVQHAKFGLGVIINAEGSGSDARVQVNFGNAGVKWLALSIAKLEAA